MDGNLRIHRDSGERMIISSSRGQISKDWGAQKNGDFASGGKYWSKERLKFSFGQAGLLDNGANQASFQITTIRRDACRYQGIQPATRAGHEAVRRPSLATFLSLFFLFISLAMRLINYFSSFVPLLGLTPVHLSYPDISF